MTRLADQEARDLIRTALDSTLVVEAAAGTGKTTELVNQTTSKRICSRDSWPPATSRLAAQ